MAIFHENLTLDELLRDPVTRAVMKADHVDASALESQLRSLAPVIGRASVGLFVGGSGQRDETSRCFAARRNIFLQLCGAP